jgi:hypothetical protein
MPSTNQENFSINIDTDNYNEYKINMPYFELKIAIISCEEDKVLDINYDYKYDLDDIPTMKHNLNNFEIYFDDIDIDKLVYVEIYYCVPEGDTEFIETVYQSPKYTEEDLYCWSENML